MLERGRGVKIFIYNQLKGVMTFVRKSEEGRGEGELEGRGVVEGDGLEGERAVEAELQLDRRRHLKLII